MVEIFKELIATFHTARLPQPIRRNMQIPPLPADVRKAYVFIGMRRSGKTWSLYEIMQNLLGQGLLYINFEDERLSDMQSHNFQDIIKAYFELYPSYLNRDDLYFFFDEIHEIDGWQKFIRRLLDQESMKLFITGSSAKMLSKEIASSLRGRTLVQEIFPFHFREYLEKLSVPMPPIYGTKQKIALVHHVRNFLRYGGFPETIGVSDDLHRTLLQGYISSVIYRDIIERYGIGNPHVLKQLLIHCLRNSATLFSINKMHRTFKSMDYEVSKNTLYEYMRYIEDAYCIFMIPKYDLSHRKSAQSIKKIYAVDQGLITACTMSSEFDLGAQLETAVFVHLRRKGNTVYYYHTTDGKEVDFLSIAPDQTMRLYQVSLSLRTHETRLREFIALEQAMQELNLKKGTIVTLDEEESIERAAGLIQVIPAWKFL